MRPRLGTRTTTLALLAVLGLVLGSQVLVDRKLEEEDRTHAEADAALAALAVQDYVALHLTALTAFEGVLVEGDAGRMHDRERFLSGVAALNAGSARVRGFRRVWVADSAGQVLNDYVFGEMAPPLAVGFDLDTVTDFRFGEVLAAARQSRRPQVTRPGRLFTGDSGVIVVVPLFSGERLAGFAGGSIVGQTFLTALPDSTSARRVRMTLWAGDRPVARLRSRLGASGAVDAPLVVRERIEVPGSGPWTLTLEYAAPNFWLRMGSWAAGLSVLAVLTLAFMHERRQANRIADRSSELERLSAELLAANRAKSEFLANISHELRTPLNAIVGFADLLRDGVYGELNPRQAGPVQRIEVSATHLRQLVDQILDLAKITAGRLEVHVEPIDLRPFVLDTASEVEPLINEKGLSLSIAVGATLPRVRTDPSHLRQILVNLLGNAVKYTESGGIAIRARLVRTGEKLPTRDGQGASPPTPMPGRPETSWIALQVVDTGPGIAADDRERIFEEFEQVNAGPRGDSARRGTGLGLPISRRLARLLGGEVSVDSEIGRGSTFMLWLPVDG